MAEDVKRYSGPPTTRGSYMNEFLVECPKCQKEALVFYENRKGKLSCLNCNHVESGSDRIRYKAIVKRSCDNCGKPFEIAAPYNKKIVEELTIPCPNCRIVRTLKARNDEYKLVYKNTGIGDPVFNLPLWLQCDIRGNQFWAYNREHLNEIRSYVSSRLRERQTMSPTTMVERLPNFIKEARNRETIVKAIDKLLRK
jgi:ssDNA-binding Zn-finger/Zn-ribbon topoisomerase 1